MRGSDLGFVFRIVFRNLAREFASVETFPGFARLLGEHWGFQKLCWKKKMLNDKSSNESCNFMENNMFSSARSLKKQIVNKNPVNLQCLFPGISISLFFWWKTSAHSVWFSQGIYNTGGFNSENKQLSRWPFIKVKQRPWWIFCELATPHSFTRVKT